MLYGFVLGDIVTVGNWSTSSLAFGGISTGQRYNSALRPAAPSLGFVFTPMMLFTRSVVPLSSELGASSLIASVSESVDHVWESLASTEMTTELVSLPSALVAVSVAT